MLMKLSPQISRMRQRVHDQLLYILHPLPRSKILQLLMLRQPKQHPLVQFPVLPTPYKPNTESHLNSGPDIPYCVTPHFGRSWNYSILAYHATRPWGSTKVHLTYIGQSTIGHLHRYLDDDGKITYATRIRHPESSTPPLSSVSKN